MKGKGITLQARAVGVVEVLLILVVLIFLILIFKTQLTELVNDIFENMKGKAQLLY